jgi:hypothetical protein
MLNSLSTGTTLPFTFTVAVHEEVPKEEAAVETVGALKKRYRNLLLTVRRRGQQKKRTQGNGGSRNKLAAACRGMTCLTIPAWCKGHCCQGQGKGQGYAKNPQRTAVREETSRETGRHEWNKEPRFKKQLHLGSERTSSGVYWKALVLEIVKRRVRAFSWDSKN